MKSNELTRIILGPVNHGRTSIAAPAHLVARVESGVKLRACARIHRSGIHLFHRRFLGRSEACGGIGALAQKLLRIEIAAPVIGDQAVLHPIERIALLQYRVLNHFQFGGRNIRFRRAGHDAVPEFALDLAGPVIGRVSGYDAVEVRRETLCFHQALLSALGTSCIDRFLHVLCIEGVDQRLGVNGRQVQAAVAVVNQAIANCTIPLVPSTCGRYLCWLSQNRCAMPLP